MKAQVRAFESIQEHSVYRQITPRGGASRWYFRGYIIQDELSPLRGPWAQACARKGDGRVGENKARARSERARGKRKPGACFSLPSARPGSLRAWCLVGTIPVNQRGSNQWRRSLQPLYLSHPHDMFSQLNFISYCFCFYPFNKFESWRERFRNSSRTSPSRFGSQLFHIEKETRW